MRIEARSLARIMRVVDRAAMRALERELPGKDMTPVWALVMEMYETYLGEDFRKQMTEKYGIEYPLDIEAT